MHDAMALYLHPENQTLIWTALCGTPLFAAWAAPAGEKARVFREKVGEVYDARARFQRDPARLSAQELGQMNRAAIASIAAHVQALRAAPPDRAGRAPGPAEGPAKSPGGSALMRDFDGRAREYDSMRAPPAPREIQFADGAAEGPLANMDELVQRCMRERDMDLRAHAAPPLTLDPRAPDAPLSGVVALDDPGRRARAGEWPSAEAAGKSVSWDAPAAAPRPTDALAEQVAQLFRESAAAAALSAARHAEITRALAAVQAAVASLREPRAAPPASPQASADDEAAGGLAPALSCEEGANTCFSGRP